MAEYLPKAAVQIFTGKLKVVGFALDSFMQKYFKINCGCKIRSLKLLSNLGPLHLVVGVR